MADSNILDWLFGKLDKSAQDVIDTLDKRSYTSIADRASEGILQFPLIASESLDISTIQMVAKACERQYASFMEIVLTMNPEVVGSNVDIADYLHQFHQNVTTDRPFRGLRDRTTINMDSYTVEITPIEGNMKMYEQYAHTLKPFIDDFVVESLNSKYSPSLRNNVKVVIPLKEASTKGKTHEHKSRRSVTNNISTNNYNIRDSGSQKMYRRVEDLVPRNILLDNDVKKANELVPTTLHVRIIRRADENSGEANYLDFIIGIKAMIHPVPSEEMIDNLVDAANNKDNIFNFIRWTSGEISFFKDFIFKINDIKKTVSKVAGGASPWWLTLKTRSAKANMMRPVANKLLPNSSFIISNEEVDYIKANFGHDLKNRRTARKIIDEYFLLGFIIVDTASEVVYIMYENDPDFQTITFNGLERENGDAVKQFRDMLKATQKF